jgi:aspartyl protease family protein
MLRKLLIVGVSAGLSASIPIVYQKDPELFHRLVRTTLNSPPPTDHGKVASVPPVVRRAADTDMPLGRKVRLSADDRGHFSADFRLNGRSIAALIDTGATLVAINASTARRIGIQLQTSDFKYKVETANGMARAAAATIDNLQIGRIFVEDVQAVVLEDSALDTTLIGMSFLKRLNKFEVRDDSLTLAQ